MHFWALGRGSNEDEGLNWFEYENGFDFENFCEFEKDSACLNFFEFVKAAELEK